MHANAKQNHIDNPGSMWDAPFLQWTTCYDKTHWLVRTSRQLTRVTKACGQLLVLAHSGFLPDQRGSNIRLGIRPPAENACLTVWHVFYLVAVIHKDWNWSAMTQMLNEVFCYVLSSQLPGCIASLIQLQASDSRHAVCHKKIHLPTGNQMWAHKSTSVINVNAVNAVNVVDLTLDTGSLLGAFQRCPRSELLHSSLTCRSHNRLQPIYYAP